MRRPSEERGVALIMVIVVLLALLVIATPFTISMRNQSRNATEMLHQEKARRDCEMLRDMLIERLEDTHPDRDLLTPLHDHPGEWKLDLRSAGMVKSTGSLERIGSARAVDLQGRINLNTASIYLLANLLGERTWISLDMERGGESIEVRDASSFAEEGLLWINGEAFSFTRRDDEAFFDLQRGIELPNLEGSVASAHKSGTDVLDFRSFLMATYCYKWQPGAFVSFPTVESIRNIAVFGEEALERSRLEAVEDLVTIRSGLPEGRRFVNPQRILGADMQSEACLVVVENGRFVGPGSIVRITVEGRRGVLSGSGTGKDEDRFHSLVLQSVPIDDTSWAVLLQEQPPYEIPMDGSAVLDVAARHPVNVNTASAGVLAVCIEGLGLIGQGQRIQKRDAELIAAAITRAAAEAPLKGWLDLDDVFKKLMEEEPRITDFHRAAVMINAMNSNDAFLLGGTAPFTFESGGFFAVETAVSLGYKESGREAARQFFREVVHPAPTDTLNHLVEAQAAFEEARRLTREGRGYMTLPVNLNVPEGSNTPPTLIGPVLSEGLEPPAGGEAAGVRLAPLRTPEERVLHFDFRSEYEEEQAGGDSDDFGDSGEDEETGESGEIGVTEITQSGQGDENLEAALNDLAIFEKPRGLNDDPEGFVTGKDVVRLPTDEFPVSILGGPFSRVWPFSVELWYRFDELGGEHYIFDCGLQEEFDRIYLYHDGKELVFRVADVTEPVVAEATTTAGSHDPLEYAEIRYDFSDLALQAGVFYHITCMTIGTKPSDLCLFVDGVPRGQRSFQTRLKESLSSAMPIFFTGDAPTISPAAEKIKVEDATRFPNRGVLRIGHELLEYDSRTDDTFHVSSRWDDRFGGRTVRNSMSEDHEETEIVELYGYTSFLQSDVIPRGSETTGDRIGPFKIALIDNQEVEPVGFMTARLPDGSDYPLGEGFECTGVESLPLMSLEGTQLEGDEFQESGGFAVIFSDLGSQISVTIDREDGSQDQYQLSFRSDAGRPVSSEGSLINGFEVIEYESFDGTNLTGIKRGWEGGYPLDTHREFPLMADKSLNQDEDWGNTGTGTGTGTGQVNSEFADIPQFIRKRAFWTYVEEANRDMVDDTEYPRIFVIPISADVAAGSGRDLYEGFFCDPDSLNPKSGLVQIGLDFTGTQDDNTEWIRYNSIVGDRFCRDDPREVRRVGPVLSPFCFNPDATLDPVDYSHRINNVLQFRAQDGTPHTGHDSGAMVLPVFRTEANGTAMPGRHDRITLVDWEGDREPAVINFAAYNDRDFGNVNLVALRSGVLGDFKRMDLDWAELRKEIEDKEEEGTTAEAVKTLLNLEARDFTRIVKFPSGELPTTSPEEFVLGGDLFGKPSPSEGCIDEVAFRSFTPPGEDLPTFTRYVLWQELEEEDPAVDELRLSDSTLFYNYQLNQNSMLEEFEILSSIPQSGSFFLIGDEIIGCTEVDQEEGYISIAPNGRGLFGTEPGYHGAGERVVILNFPVVSFLKGNMNTRSSEIPLIDAGHFPLSGTVLIDTELVSYNRKDESFLTMPIYMPFGTEKERGLFRGRFGTEVTEHQEDALVYLIRERVPDLYAPGCDAPEQAFFSLGFEAPGAFYSSLNWVERLHGEGSDLVALVRVGGRDRWEHDPEKARDLFLFEDPGKLRQRNGILRQGDRLEVRFFTRFAQNAFDAHDFSSNLWKCVPTLEAVNLECLEPTRFYRRDEWR